MSAKKNATTKTKTKPVQSSQPTSHVGCFVVTAVVAVLIGALAMLSLALSGLEGALLTASTVPTKGKVYVATECYHNSDACRDEIEALRNKHQGATVGSLKLYQDTAISGGYQVISAKAVADLLLVNPASLTSEQIPVFVSDATAADDLPKQAFAVGSYDTFTFEQLEQTHAGIFTPLTRQLSSTYQSIFWVDDGTDKIANYLLSLQALDRENTVKTDLADFLKYEKQVIAFNDYRDALAYQKDAERINDATVEDLFSNTLDIHRVFAQGEFILNAILIVFVLVVVSVILVKVLRKKLSN